MRPGKRPCTIAIRRTSFDSNWDSINPATVQLNNRYTRAASTLRDWLKSGALKRDAQPTLYYHTIEYTPPYAPSGSPTKTLKGILATVKLEALDSGHIYPHENTRSAAKTDRLNLLEACKSNFSPIWSLYSDPQGAVMGLLEAAVKGNPASIDFRDDVGFRQQLWAVTDPAVLEHAVDALRSKPLFIADGHHRYETALNYQKLRRQQAGSPAGQHPYDGVLMLLTAPRGPGLNRTPDAPGHDHGLCLLMTVCNHCWAPHSTYRNFRSPQPRRQPRAQNSLRRCGQLDKPYRYSGWR